MSSRRNDGVSLWGVFMLLIVGALSWFTTPVRLEFGNDVLKALSTMFGYLILISLFVERTIEVFLSAWRGQGADELDFEINNKRNYVKENIDPSIYQQSGVSSSEEIIMVLKKELEELEKKRIRYSARSRFPHFRG